MPKLNTAFVGSTNTINICLIVLIFSFIPASDCVGRGPSTRLYSEPIMLLRRPWVSMHANHYTTDVVHHGHKVHAICNSSLEWNPNLYVEIVDNILFSYS